MHYVFFLSKATEFPDVQESGDEASSPDQPSSIAVVGSPDDPARRTQAWLKESVEDTFSDSDNETEESLLSEVSRQIGDSLVSSLSKSYF